MNEADRDMETAATNEDREVAARWLSIYMPEEWAQKELNSLAAAIAQARVNAERERDEWRLRCMFGEVDDDGDLSGHDRQVHDALLRQRDVAIRDCDALAAKVEALSDALTDAISSVSSGRIGTCQYGRIYTAQVFLAAVDCWRTALAATPAASLIAHDNALIERCAAECEVGRGYVIAELALQSAAAGIRALKTDSEGSKWGLSEQTRADMEKGEGSTT